MKVFVTGASGQLGHDVCLELERREIPFCAPTSKEMDITDREAVLHCMEEARPDAVIHCAAYTKVDLAEDEPERCWAVNADGTRNIAEVCRKLGSRMLYISTDYVFPGDGDRFYEPTDPVGPATVYGRSKLAGELAVQSMLTEYFIVRISWVFGKNGNNFVKTMLRLAETRSELNVVCDQIGSPTYTADLAPLLCDMVQTERYGIYHATNEGICSWAEFAQEVFAQAGKDVTVRPVTTAEYAAKAQRPLNSRLSKKSLQNAGLALLPGWQDAVRRFLMERK